MSIIVILIILSLTDQVSAQSSAFEKHTFDNGAGFTLPYRLYIPENILPDKKYPLVIFLHGAGDWGTDNSSQLANFPYHYIDATNSTEYTAYYLAPQCTEQSPWSSFPGYPEVFTPATPTQSTAQVLALIDTLLHSDTINIDLHRIYVTGFSLGGEGAFDIITRAPGLFAAAVPICGIADTAKASLMTNTPLWIFHGSEDNINSVTYSRIIVDALTNIGKPPKYTEYEGYDHYVWDKAYGEAELLPWIFSHDKSATGISNRKSVSFERRQPISSLLNKNGMLHISWRPSIHPERIELFSLDGRRLLKKMITRDDRSGTILDPAENGIATGMEYVIRISADKKSTICRINRMQQH
jgi:poly(3-hydroxybutyrate) depolymerase